MNFKQACTILGVQPNNVTEHEVTIAFRRAVRLAHPDVGGKGGDVDRCVEAKDFLLKSLGGECKTCKGKGAVHGFKCKACNGRGK